MMKASAISLLAAAALFGIAPPELLDRRGTLFAAYAAVPSVAAYQMAGVLRCLNVTLAWVTLRVCYRFSSGLCGRAVAGMDHCEVPPNRSGFAGADVIRLSAS